MSASALGQNDQKIAQNSELAMIAC